MEFLLLNDAHDQEYLCDVPGVRCVNLLKRCDSLGHKRNLINGYAKHEIRITVDDDDIFLPWLVETSVEEMYKRMFDHFGLFVGTSYFLMEYAPDGTFTIKPNGRGCTGFPIYTKTLFNVVGGYPLMNSGQDRLLVNKFWKFFATKYGMTLTDLNRPTTVPPAYIYRKNHGVEHFSNKTNKREWDYARLVHESDKKRETGTIELQPFWRMDYVSACRDALTRWKSGKANEHRTTG